MRNRFKLGTVAGCLLAMACTLKAGPGGEDALLEQVKQVASNGQDAQTAAQVSEYVDQNHDLITSILKGYARYLNQVQAMADDDGSGAPSKPRGARGGVPGAQNGGAAQNEGAAQSVDTATPQAGNQEGASPLQISGVKASGGLRTSHLAGLPALPAVEPASSITQPTAAQLDYAAKTQKEMRARKAYLMEHPEGYTY